MASDLPALGCIDVHAHLTDARVLDCVDDVLQRCAEHGVGWILTAATTAQEWDDVLCLATRPGIAGALGVHPWYADSWDASLAALLRSRFAGSATLRAVGEIGLDFAHAAAAPARRRQAEVFEEQLSLAVELGAPVVLHTRRAWEPFFGIWNNVAADRIGGVCHAFGASREIARRALDAGLYLSFGGAVTYSRKAREAVVYAPVDRLLSETDTPDLPIRRIREDGGQSRPWHVIEIVREMARLRDTGESELRGNLLDNARRALGAHHHD